MNISNQTKMDQIRSIIGDITKKETNRKGFKTFSKSEMQFIVKAVTGKDVAIEDFRTGLRSNLPKWSKQSTADTFPTSENLNMILQEITKKDGDNNNFSVGIDLNLLMRNVLAGETVKSVFIDLSNNNIVIDFK